LGGQVAGLARPADVHLDHLDLADAAAADILDGGAELAVGALLAAGLQDAVELAHRVDHGRGLVGGQRQRLLAVNVLLRLAGIDGEDGVPVVGGGDDDGVDVVALEEVAVVVVGGAALVSAGLGGVGVALLDGGLGALAAGGVHVAHG